MLLSIGCHTKSGPIHVEDEPCVLLTLQVHKSRLSVSTHSTKTLDVQATTARLEGAVEKDCVHKIDANTKLTFCFRSMVVLWSEPFRSFLGFPSFCVSMIADSAIIGLHKELVIFDTTYLWLEASY